MGELQHILVIDDDERLRQLLQRFLSENGFFVSVAESAAQAREKMRYFLFDALVLDLMMPVETGLQFAESLPAQHPPVLMLTAMSEAADRVRGLETGADDYLTKPFEPKELVLRLRNLLRRTSAPVVATAVERKEVRFGAFRFEVASSRLFRDSEAVYLTSAEEAMLKLLAAHAGTPVTRQALADVSVGAQEKSSERSVDVQINRLRKKIESTPGRPVYIRTMRGAGYILQTD